MAQTEKQRERRAREKRLEREREVTEMVNRLINGWLQFVPDVDCRILIPPRWA